MLHWYQKITKTKFGKIQVKIFSQIGQKIDENGEKCRKLNINLSQFLAILRHFKGHETAIGVCKMASGVPLVSKKTKTIFWYSTSQNIEPKWAKN